MGGRRTIDRLGLLLWAVLSCALWLIAVPARVAQAAAPETTTLTAPADTQAEARAAAEQAPRPFAELEALGAMDALEALRAEKEKGKYEEEDEQDEGSEEDEEEVEPPVAEPSPVAAISLATELPGPLERLRPRLGATQELGPLERLRPQLRAVPAAAPTETAVSPPPAPKPAPESDLESEPEPESPIELDDAEVLQLTPKMSFAPGSRVVSAPTLSHSANVLAALASARNARRDLPMGARSATFDGIIRTMLRPMLAEWLENNLPTLMERLVKKELDFMVRRGRAEDLMELERRKVTPGPDDA